MDLKASIRRSSCTFTLPFNEQFRDHVLRYELGIVFGFSTVEEPDFVRGYDGACHAYLNRINDWAPMGTLKTYYSQLRSVHPNAEEYWDSLLDPKTSPWRSVLHNPTIIRNDEGKAIAFSTDIKSETNSQCLANLSIATRKPAENASFMQTWLELRDATGDPNLATLGSHHALYGPKTDLILYRATPGHHCIPIEGHSINNFLNGTPVTLKNLLVSTRSGYSPCNAIWAGKTFVPALIKMKKETDLNLLFNDVYMQIKRIKYGEAPSYTTVKDLSKFLLEAKENPNA